MFLQTLGGLALRGDVLEAGRNKGPQRKTLERLAYVLLEKEVSRDIFAELFFAYADDPQRELRRAIRNLNAYFEKQGLDEAVVLERKTIKANFSTDFDLLEEALNEHDTQKALSLYKGAFFVHVTRETGVFREWVFEKRRYLAKRLFDAVILELETKGSSQALLSQAWLLFEHATDFGIGPNVKDDRREERRVYIEDLFVQISSWLRQQSHPDLLKAQQLAKAYGFELAESNGEIALTTEPALDRPLEGMNQAVLQVEARFSALSLVLAILWFVLGLYVAFMNYGYFSASEKDGYWHPTPFFAEMSLPLAPFYGMIGGGALFLLFLLFTRELLKGRSGPWYSRLPIFNLLPEQFSRSFKISMCTVIFLVFGVVPGYTQIHFFRAFFGFTSSHAWIHKVVRAEDGRTKPGTFVQIQGYSPVACAKKYLRCMMLLHPYPRHSMWVREFVYGHVTRGDHIDFYPYWGPALIMLWMSVVFSFMVRVLLQLFGWKVSGLKRLLRFSTLV